MECLLIGLGAYFIQHMGSFNYGKIRTMGAVLVAISIPIFNSQLEKSRDAVTVANIRAAYAQASTDVLTGSSTSKTEYSSTQDVVSKGTQAGLSDLEKELPIADASKTTLKESSLGNTPGTYKVTFTWSVTDGKIADTPTVTVGNK